MRRKHFYSKASSFKETPTNIIFHLRIVCMIISKNHMQTFNILGAKKSS